MKTDNEQELMKGEKRVNDRVCFAIACLLVSLLCGSVGAETCMWDDGGGDGLWSNPLNWSGDIVPQPGDEVVFDGAATSDCRADIVSNNLASITLNSGYTGTVTFAVNAVEGASVITLAGDFNVNGGTVILAGNTNSAYGSGYSIAVAGNITVGAQGTMSANACGFGNSAGPGAGLSANRQGAGGGTYGGLGGVSWGGNVQSTKSGTNLYGSAVAPVALGSGGGSDTNSISIYAPGGGCGGGAIKLVAVSGTVTIDGVISADGEDAVNLQGGGGSGGSLWIACRELAGHGTISAEGGRGGPFGIWAGGGGGGGGRIKLEYVAKTFDGVVSASGGAFGNGSMFEGRCGFPGTFSFPDGEDVTVKASFALVPGNYNIPVLRVLTNAVLLCQGNVSTTSGVAISSTTVTVDCGGSISASWQGFGAAAGPGAGLSGELNGGGGGSYGGRGGWSTGGNNGGTGGGSVLYGLTTAPTALGSGGGNELRYPYGGGCGGGAVKISAPSGTVTVNGSLSSDGGYGLWKRQGGGGSGGSVWIVCNALAGNGLISARGGDGGEFLTWSSGGGGGGGRIKLECNAQTFTGTVTARGGVNGAEKTDIGSAGYAGTFSFPDGEDVTVNGCFALAPGCYNIPKLTVLSNSELSCQGDATTTGGVTILSKTINIHTGGMISGDAQGFESPTGPGFGGSSASKGGGGGSYGGVGGASGSGIPGGNTYGVAKAPALLGSSGGSQAGNGGGGHGGGAVKLVADDTLTIDGTVSSVGEPARNRSRGGGGSGGSVWLHARTLAGTGNILAGGGSGSVVGGGGGGGRIRLAYAEKTFAGVVAAPGGLHGATSGGDGLAGSVFDAAIPNPATLICIK